MSPENIARAAYKMMDSYLTSRGRHTIDWELLTQAQKEIAVGLVEKHLHRIGQGIITAWDDEADIVFYSFVETLFAGQEASDGNNL